MKILFDNGTPRSVSRCLVGHEITRTREIGWHELENGELIQRAEDDGYDLLLSTDKTSDISKTFRIGSWRWLCCPASSGQMFNCILIRSPRR